MNILFNTNKVVWENGEYIQVEEDIEEEDENDTYSFEEEEEEEL